MSAARLRLAIVSPLPPVPSGPADFVGNLAPCLATHADVVLLTDQPDSVPRALSEVADVRRLTRGSLKIADLNIYHIANNHHQAFAVDAALSGPAGLLTLHDVSQHHLVEFRFLGHGEPDQYRRVLQASHGEAGSALVRLRATVPPLQSEPFLFDCIGPLLSRHRGAIVHSMFARDVVATREPALPSYVIPHFAIPDGQTVVRREALGLDPAELVIAHFGYLTLPKRPVVVLEAFARLLQDGIRARLIFAGAAETHTLGMVRGAIDRLGIADCVEITGYLPENRMRLLIGATDIVVSLRWPHVGESSGTVVQALAAGRALVTQRIGSWAELPADVIAEVPVGTQDHEIASIHRTFRLLLDPERRRRLGAAARDYVRRSLDPDLYARRVVESARDLLAHHHSTPRKLRAEARQRISRSRETDAGTPSASLLNAICPAVGGERLLAVHVPDNLVRALTSEWGYEVTNVHELGEIRLLPAGGFSVALSCGTPLPPPWLAALNGALSATGLLIIDIRGFAYAAMQPEQLEDSGFLVESYGTISVARKVHLPADSARR